MQTSASHSVPINLATHLLSATAEIADTYSNRAQRREAVLVSLAEGIGADAGVWAWGRGTPEASSVQPVAVIYIGVNEEQRVTLMQWGMSPETDRTFRQPIRQQMGDRRSITTLWPDIFTPEQWDAMPFMRSQLLQGGWSSWLHSVRYSEVDTWSSLFLLRRAGQTEFGPSESAAAELVLSAVPWMHSSAEETVSVEVLKGLTPRQKLVMLMLLDGLARKAIAQRLKITEDTVGDHIKVIYAHFGVASVGELAALFLRGR